MKSILVVDDEESLLSAIQTILEAENFVVQLAANGPAALDCLSSQKIDLVLLDRMMPIMSGLQMLKAMQGKEGHRQIPVILMSASKEPPQEEGIRWVTFLAKPFDLNRLLDAVTAALGET